ncbi:MAG: DUF4476 domain-containing protein [Bacteroidetes bacterium]|nr:DUF4476 domain-containing protein [Bacteroidota bacterium]
MKRTITLLTLIVLSALITPGFAVSTSKLHLDLFNDGTFEVHIDGQRYLNVVNGIDVANINAGTHSVKIIEVFRGRAHRGNGRSVLYNGSINIPFRSAVFARLTPNFQLRITEIRNIPPPPAPRARQYNDRRNGPTYNGRRRFEDVKAEMKRASFDDDKLRIARQYVSEGGCTSSEVASMMNEMSFDKNRLELAKYAYDYTDDPQNYNLVDEAFDFDSSVRDLNKHIVGRGRK